MDRPKLGSNFSFEANVSSTVRKTKHLLFGRVSEQSSLSFVQKDMEVTPGVLRQAMVCQATAGSAIFCGASVMIESRQLQKSEPPALTSPLNESDFVLVVVSVEAPCLLFARLIPTRLWSFRSRLESPTWTLSNKPGRRTFSAKP